VCALIDVFKIDGIRFDNTTNFFIDGVEWAAAAFDQPGHTSKRRVHSFSPHPGTPT
jgi:hypothetical protein